MSKTEHGKKDPETYTIPGTDEVVKAGDCVLMRSSNLEKPYVARVEKVKAANPDDGDDVRVHVFWYYLPEETDAKRQLFHGAKEVFLSDCYDDKQSARSIDGKCVVHSLESYTKLKKNVGAEDYFCRFHYKFKTGEISPDLVPVYCKCEMPYNPDDFMVQCEKCKDWFHPSCLGITNQQAESQEHFLCSNCPSETKRSPNVIPVSSPASQSKETWRDSATG